MTSVDLGDLTTWLATKRWFGSKDRAIRNTRIDRVFPITGVTSETAPPVWMVLVDVAYDDGPDDRWLLILGDPGNGPAVGTVGGQPVAEIAERPELGLALVEAMRNDRVVGLPDGGVVQASSRPALALSFPAAAGDGSLPGVRSMGVEQSNTSVVIASSTPDGAAIVLKIIRRVEAGPNPDIELTGALSDSQFPGVPPLVGTITGPADEAMVVASAFVRDAQGAWELAVQEAAGRIDHGVAAGMRALGALTAAMHQRLHDLLETGTGEGHAAVVTRRVTGQGRRTAKMVGRRSVAMSAQLRREIAATLAKVPATPPALQRVHGDFHLGQVLRDGEGAWWILDFEGEPARSIDERRTLASPAKDVAGLLRSLDYARGAAVLDGADPAEAATWARLAREAFLAGYGESLDEWLPIFELEKLLYEIRYEFANRPDWLTIPLGALGIHGALDSITEAPSPNALPESPPSEPVQFIAGRRSPNYQRTDEMTMAAKPKKSKKTSSEPKSNVAQAAEATAADPVAEPDEAGAPGDAGLESAMQALFDGRHQDPHSLLGFHQTADGWVARAWRPGASSVAYLNAADADPIPATHVADALWEVHLTQQPQVGQYRWHVAYEGGDTFDVVDPYAFAPTLGELDQHLLAEGRHEQAWTVMGANRHMIEGIDGVAFTVWAPNAHAVRIVGEFTTWDGRLLPMRTLGSSGIWELFVPDVPDGTHYKYELVTADGTLATRADPWAKWTEVPPGTASRVFTSTFVAQTDWTPPEVHEGPLSVYELHLASWRHADGEFLSYRQLAEQLGEYLIETGFTHVELLPPAEHPFGGSWGYQVTGQFAPTSRFGSPDDFRYLVDHLHSQGIGVIVDWVPAHFPKDEWALRRFDGTALYEHEDPRLGEHPDWGTMVFNYGRTEVRNFIVASALFWIESMGVDSLRVDAVASMLYLDYSREDGEWIPNEYGGNENLAAVQLLQETNATVYKRNPGVFTVAEESTAWPGVTRPTHLGGLGFGFKWNMGWMHDTLEYFAREPIYRKYHHNQLTFGLMYAFNENFLLPLSHDEVVHGKGSLIGKMPGDRWQQFANLRCLYGWMWGHPGKKLLFMGQEFGQDREWSEERQLDWFLLDNEGSDNPHRGVKDLIGDLNRAYRDNPAMWNRDGDPGGFRWIEANNSDQNVLSFLRLGKDGDPDIAVVANLSPVPLYEHRLGLPSEGRWEEIVNTDADRYGGGNIGNMGGVDATAAGEGEESHGMPSSAIVTCPPLGVVWLRGPS